MGEYTLNMNVLVTQLCPTLCNSMDHSPPGFSVHGFLQTRILEWVAIPYPGNLPNPGIKPGSLASSALEGGVFVLFFSTTAPPGKLTQRETALG